MLRATPVVVHTSDVDLQRGARLFVGRRFLQLRPRIAAVGALLNAGCLAAAGAPAPQKVALGIGLGTTVTLFFVEARALSRRALTERWLFVSLALTLVAISGGAAVSGGVESPLLVLAFAPVVVGFAAFGRARASGSLLALALVAFLSLTLLGPLPGFPPPPAPWRGAMSCVSAVMALALLAAGVIGLVDGYARAAAELDRRRGDALREAELRAASVEHLGAQVAHEVKNPLAAVRGLVQLVHRGATDERDRERLGVVLDEVDRALARLADYLGFARPVRDLELGPVDVRALIDDVAGVLEARARERDLQVDVRVTEGLVVHADRRRLHEALLNLALNAIAATSRGGRLGLSAERSEEGVTLTVADDGAGMPPAVLARVGEPFASTTEGGTGLGVLLARGVARQHGGQLRYESAPGEGTRASLLLPSSEVG